MIDYSFLRNNYLFLIKSYKKYANIPIAIIINIVVIFSIISPHNP